MLPDTQPGFLLRTKSKFFEQRLSNLEILAKETNATQASHKRGPSHRIYIYIPNQTGHKTSKRCPEQKLV